MVSRICIWFSHNSALKLELHKILIYVLVDHL